jgi:threonylcarbamoyladenosine tRNA methylthiotransferase CDKAL1
MEASMTKVKPAARTTTKICVVANGCHENFNDARLLKQYMGDTNDVVLVDSYKDADLICLLGCANTKHMEMESQDLKEHIEATKRPESKLLIMGCLAKIRPDLATEQEELDASLGQLNPDAMRFREIESSLSAHSLYCDTDPEVMNFKTARKEKIFTKNFDAENASLMRRVSFPVRSALFTGVKLYKDHLESKINVYNDKCYCLKICTGCLGSCTYCIIRYSRGKIQSKPMEKIMEEFHQGLSQGYRDFALIGTDLGDYGQDVGLNFPQLLSEMVAVPGDFRLRLRNVNPRGIIAYFPEFFEVLKSRKIIYLLSPVQSGNNRVLETMGRGYKIEEILSCMAKIRAAYPFVVLQSQIIAGFPTETDEEFMDSKAVVDKSAFDYIDIFRYSDRYGTKASGIYPKVPEETIMERYRSLFFRALINHPVRKLQATRRLG